MRAVHRPPEVLLSSLSGPPPTKRNLLNVSIVTSEQ